MVGLEYLYLTHKPQLSNVITIQCVYNNISLLGFKSTDNSQHCLHLTSHGYFDTALSSANPEVGDYDTALSGADPEVGHYDTALSSATPRVGHFDTALLSATPAVGYFDIAIIEGFWQNVLAPKQTCSNAFHAYRLNIFILNSINSLTWMLRVSSIQFSYTITQVLHFMFVILNFIKMTGINYGIWASISTRWLWDIINRFPDCIESPRSITLKILITLHQNIMFKHDHAICIVKNIQSLAYFNIIDASHLLSICLLSISSMNMCHLNVRLTILMSMITFSTKSQLNFIHSVLTQDVLIGSGGSIKFSGENLTPYIVNNSFKQFAEILTFCFVEHVHKSLISSQSDVGLCKMPLNILVPQLPSAIQKSILKQHDIYIPVHASKSNRITLLATKETVVTHICPFLNHYNQL